MVQETGVQSWVDSYQRLKKLVLDANLVSTQYYKSRIKGKVAQSIEKSSALPNVYNWKGSLRVANFITLYKHWVTHENIFINFSPVGFGCRIHWLHHWRRARPSWTSLLDMTLSNSIVKFQKWRCPWCNGYRRKKWTRRHEFKSSTKLIVFHIALIPLGKLWIQLFSLQLWVNSRADWFLQPWWGN